MRACVVGQQNAQKKQHTRSAHLLPAHDLIRLGLSMASAARGSDLPGVTTARMMEQIIEGYEQSFAPAADADDELPAVVQTAMKAAH